MSYISERIASSVNPVEVANRLGLEVNRASRAKCCFHNGDSNNLFINNKPGGTYHCYVCNAHGDSIGLVKHLLGIGYVDAIKYLDKEFMLGVLDENASDVKIAGYNKIKQVDKYKKQQKQIEYDALLDMHRKYHQKLKEHPKSWEEMDDGFIEALQNIDQVAYKIDCMEEEMYGKEK